MGTQLSTFQDRLETAMGQEGTVVDEHIRQGVNFAVALIALMFDPPELQTSGSLSISVGGTSVSLSTLTRPRLIKHVWNVTSAAQVFEVPFDKWLTLVQTGSGNVKFYSRDGMTLYTRPTPTAGNTLTAYYNQYPDYLLSAGDEVPYAQYDDLINSYAQAYAWACQEEKDASDLWNTLGDKLGAPALVMKEARRFMEGYPNYVSNLR